MFVNLGENWTLHKNTPLMTARNPNVDFHLRQICASDPYHGIRFSKTKVVQLK